MVADNQNLFDVPFVYFSLFSPSFYMVLVFVCFLLP